MKLLQFDETTSSYIINGSVSGCHLWTKKPNSNNMPSAQKEMNASMNEIQKTMDEMSPEEKDESAGCIFIGCGNINIARFRQLK